MDNNHQSDESNVTDDAEFKCPNCKSVDIKKSINWGEFYDCECNTCNAKFVIPVMSGINYNVISNKILYVRNNMIMDYKGNIIEFLPLSFFLAFSILAIVASVSANKFLSVPFAAIAGISLLFFLIWRIRSRSLVSN